MVMLYLSPAWTFGRRYSRLAVGMSAATVEGVFGRRPDYVCKYRVGTLAYYRRGATGDEHPDLTKLPSEVAAARDIPFLYGSGQLLFDASGRLAAYTINGEADNVVTSEGSFAGSHLGNLDDAVLARIASR